MTKTRRRAGARRRPHRPSIRPLAAAVASLAVALVAGGCDVRDEPVGAAGGPRHWPVAGTRPAADGGAGQPCHPADGEYVEGYEAAARRAAAEGRPLLLVFGASWCRWSGELTRGPLADRDVVARSRRFIRVLVDADRDAATCRAFEVTAFPTVIVLDAAGQERHRATGAGVADGLAAALDAVPTGDSGSHRLAEEGSGNGGTKDVTR